ncbi:hypothetical protein [Gorillibacterium sp. CAU 1737]|uniref:hypothetical protein n=1 Tax=Gorillibacterium sp. CAU 1737 TaxID=3140362 RepID=UPI0032605100
MDIPEYPNPQQIKSAVEYNTQLDYYLRTSKVIPKKLLLSFDEAYNNDAATSIGWLIAKLKIIEERLIRNELLSFDDGGGLDREVFRKLVSNRYPTIKDNFSQH